VGSGGVDSGSAVVNNDRARARCRRDESLLLLHRTGKGGGGGETFSAGIVSSGQGPGAMGHGQKDRGGRQQRQCECAQRREKKGSGGAVERENDLL
jgi:hypothetical protein